MFVKAPAGEFAYFGVGKLIEQQGDQCTVEFFDAPTADPIQIRLPITDVVRVTIPEQTRVYTFNLAIGAWEIGRLLDDHGDQQFVQFPNKSTRLLNVVDAFVRWAKPIDDPTPFLANKINESPRFSDGRSAFVRSQLRQRAASLGMSAILSSAIELENHQVEVVRRVLQDPVQRYLLADEVGLGKTIEAGMLIRQCLLDRGEEACVLVLVPDTLVQQWQSELTGKFHLGGMLGRQLHVVSASSDEDWRSLLNGADMLVIDEAHHLTHGGAQADHYEVIAKAAPAIERLLLLSATPALHNERGFLAMLHLLDPETYRLEDLEDFQKRIQARQALAEIVGGLVPENALYLDYTIDTLSTLFRDDTILQAHVAKLREIVEAMPAADDPDLVDAIGRTRAHLSEVYRLHRRILRHRRRSVSGLTPDRSGAHMHFYASEDRLSLSQAIDDWRFKEAVDCAGDDKRLSARHAAFRQVLERASQYPANGSGTVGFLARRPDMSGDSASFAPIVASLGRPLMFEDRASALCAALEEPLRTSCKCIVFCSDSSTADVLADRLRKTLNSTVDRHDPDKEDWTGFNEDPARLILVCDRRAEEGLNLQGGRKVLVHFDLPFNPNRLEQRLGRVDRYGSGQSVRSILLVCNDDPIERAWARYCNEALRLFDRSIASLQYLIEESIQTLAPSLFNEGAEALERLNAEHSGEAGLIESEIKALDQQDALDSLGTPPSDLVDTLCDLDDAWRHIAADTGLWLEQTLLFDHFQTSAQANGDPRAAPFRYHYATKGRHTLLPLPAFMAVAAHSLDLTPDPRFGRRIQTVPFTFSRRTALSKAGRQVGARLLRYGEPFLTALGTITNADDRGRSFALWREVQGYEANQTADPYLRFDFLVEVNLLDVEEVLKRFGHDEEAARLAVRRRGDFALPPAFSTVWLDASLEPVQNDELREMLERPYRPNGASSGPRDINVNARRWQQLNRLGISEVDHWAEFCTKGRAAAEQMLRQDSGFKDRLRLADREAAGIEFGRLSQLETRLRHDESEAKSQLAFERDLAVALRKGIAHPSMRLETIGAVFLTGSRAATERLTGGL